MRSLFPAQESNLGGWDENQESQPLDQQETVAGTKLALAVVATDKCISQEGENCKNRYNVYYQRHSTSGRTHREMA